MTKHRWSLASVLSVVLAALLPVSVLSQNLFIKNYTTANGLVSNDVTCISQDRVGRIWIGTTMGLERYDGTTHTQRRLADDGGDAVRSIWRSSHADTLIFGTGKGFIASGEEGWRTYSLAPEREPSSFRGSVTALLCDSERRLWAGVEDFGLVVVPNEGRPLDFSNRPNVLLDSLLQGVRRVYLRGRTIYAIRESSRGSVFIGTDRGAVELPRGEWSRARNPLSPFGGGRVQAIAESKSGDLWFGTDRGLYLLRDKSLRRYTRANGLPEDDVTSVVENLDGEIWVGTRHSGLAFTSGGTFRRCTVEQGLTSNRINSLFVDREGNIWVATDNGVSKILRQRYESFAEVPQLRDLVFNSVVKDHRGRMWFGVTGSVVMYDGAFHVYRGGTRLGNRSVTQIHEDARHTLWLNAGTALVRFSGSAFTVFTDPMITEQSPIAQILEDPRQTLWVPTTSRLFKMTDSGLTEVTRFPSRCSDFAADPRTGIWMSGNDGTWRYADGTLNKITSGGGSLFAGSDGNMWLVQNSGVALIRHNLNDSVETLQNPETPGRRYGYYSYNIGYEDRHGEKWFVTNFTIQHLTARGLETVQALSIPLYAQRAVEDGDGYLWLLSDKGLIRFSTVSRSFAISSALTTVTVGTRTTADFNPSVPRAALDDDGNLWVATGPTIVKWYHRPMVEVKPSVFITKILLPTSMIFPGRVWWTGGRIEIGRNDPWLQYWYDSEEETLGGSFDQNDTVRILSGSSVPEFVFKGISFSDESDIRYQHRLDNVDTDWSALSRDANASYPNLSDGVYTFRVRAVDGNGMVSDERRLSLIVTSPFWKTSWFWIYAVVALVYGAGRMYRRRIVRLRLKHREETERAVLNNELQMARKIQLGMLPTETPKGKGFAIAAKSIPAREVGGDFYDFAEINDEVYTIAVGDVSGHGLTGAMIVGMARTSLRFAMKSVKKPGDILTLANNRLYDDIKRNLFVAVFFSKLDFKARTFTYTNAGQVMPLMCRNGKATFLRYGSGDRFPLGIIQKSRYGETTIRLRKGDVVLLYTDGIVEAMNDRREEFGFDRLQQSLSALAPGSPEQIQEGLIARVNEFTGTVEKQDDITLLVIKAV